MRITEARLLNLSPIRRRRRIRHTHHARVIFLKNACILFAEHLHYAVPPHGIEERIIDMHHQLSKEDRTKRLNKIIGQLNGINRMNDEDRDCPDILIQIASARAALAKLGMMITEDHIEHCITSSSKKGQGEKSMMSLSKALKQMLK
jgi:CsoR family transcriptional regulator, copper-sensing transcriptional repressor